MHLPRRDNFLSPCRTDQCRPSRLHWRQRAIRHCKSCLAVDKADLKAVAVPAQSPSAIQVAAAKRAILSELLSTGKVRRHSPHAPCRELEIELTNVANPVPDLYIIERGPRYRKECERLYQSC